MKIQMLHTSASPERVLEAGKTYSLPASVAKPLLEPFPIPGSSGEWSFAKRVDDSARASRLPSQPDPGDVPEAIEDDWIGTEGDE